MLQSHIQLNPVFPLSSCNVLHGPMSHPHVVAVQDPQSIVNSVNRLSFVTHVKCIGRAYQNRAAELVSPCRTFQPNTEGNSPDSGAKLGRPHEVMLS